MSCALCDDTGWKPVDEKGIRRVVRCDCWREQVGGHRLAAANIPKRYQHCTLENFSAYNPSLERALEQARRVPRRFPSANNLREQGRGLLLGGLPGVGKTHLAVAVLKQVMNSSPARGLFYDTRDLLRVIRSTYDPSIRTTELEVLRPVMTADLLVLDDLGAEKTSEWVEETMNLIVNTRYNEKRLTIFTTNYEDIPDETEPNSLLCRIGHRMRSRLHEMAEFVVLDGAEEDPAGAPRRPPGSRAPSRRQRRSQVAGWTRRKLEPRTLNPGTWNLEPLGLYLHVPFCSAICNYCNFNRGLFDAGQKTRYVEALAAEIREAGLKACTTTAAATDVVQTFRSADTIYFGGGTPSLLEPAEVERIIGACRRAFDVTPDAEITLEANPETVDERK